MKGTILTNEGEYFRFGQPEDHCYTISEIAHALSHICRYTGHAREFYSVAQHSVLVSYLVPKPLALCALLHDASEAYLGDVSSPLKAMLPDYKAIEARVEKAIAEQYLLPYPLPPEVKHADLRMLMTEKRDLMPTNSRDAEEWPDIQPINYKVRPMEPKLARTYFLRRFVEIV